MTPALYLNKEETKKVEKKDSLFLKALLKAIAHIKDMTGVEVGVIGTDSDGNLYEIDLDP